MAIGRGLNQWGGRVLFIVLSFGFTGVGVFFIVLSFGFTGVGVLCILAVDSLV